MKELFRRDGDREAFDFYVGMCLGGILANPTSFAGSTRRMMLGEPAIDLVREVAGAAVMYAAELMRARENFLAGHDQGTGRPATPGGDEGGKPATG